MQSKKTVSPYRVIINTFRHKGFQQVFNQAVSIKEIVEALKVYGIYAGKGPSRQKLKIKGYRKVDPGTYIGVKPLLAVFGESHEVVVYDKAGESAYGVIDSSSRKLYKVVKKSSCSDFMILL